MHRLVWAGSNSRSITDRPEFAGRDEPRNLGGEFQGYAAEEDLRDIDKKDMVPPSKYRGDASMWRHLYTKLHTFLNRRDPRCGEMLEAVRQRSRDPCSEEYEKEIFASIGVVSSSLLLNSRANCTSTSRPTRTA